MLVEAHELTRDYGRFRAVDRVSFGIDRGEVVGLLGPNGAGKSTTIRMLTGFLPATAGSAAVAGCDVRRAPASSCTATSATCPRTTRSTPRCACASTCASAPS